jgi:glycolate oxidase iron-sulfur subunit
MKTSFTNAQLSDPAMATSAGAIRRCVHCGFCLATCPTYVLLGDELDSPRGRIYLMQDMLENERAPAPIVVKHIDRCLSCLSCVSTCPSSVDYMHLVDHARTYIEARYRRGFLDRAFRRLLTGILPHSNRFRIAVAAATFARPFLPLIRRVSALKPLTAMLALAPKSRARAAQARSSPAPGVRRGRVALMQGCVEPVLSPQIRAAAVRLLNRAGFDIVFARGEGCCGALVQHLGRHEDALAYARRNVDLWDREIDAGGLDAIVTTASGCGTTVKDYGFVLRGDPVYRDKAARISSLARDISELLHAVPGDAPRSGPRFAPGLVVAHHAACSLQHGQKIKDAPADLLRAAGFSVKDVPEGHLCCGSAGVYNILQSDIATRLRDRKVMNIESVEPDIVAAGNIGCIAQIAAATRKPVVHTVELLDWAAGGPMPAAVARLRS